MRSALIGMLLVLPAAIAYSSGSTSAYASASGKSVASSAYASKAYASASKATPSKSAGTETIQVVKSTLKLPGVSAAAFNPATAEGKKLRTAFKNSVALTLKICGTSGTAQCAGTDVVITAVSLRRSGATVEFYVKTASAASAKAGATALKTALTKNGGADFVTTLKAEAKKAGTTGFDKVTGVTVVKAPAATTQEVPKTTGSASQKKEVAAASMTAGVSLASLAFAALALQ
jgi:hypothetical protein